MFKNPNWYGGEPVGYFTSIVEDLKMGLLRTNPTNGQCETESFRVTSPALSLNGHAASYTVVTFVPHTTPEMIH